MSYVCFCFLLVFKLSLPQHVNIVMFQFIVKKSLIFCNHFQLCITIYFIGISYKYVRAFKYIGT